MLDDLISDALGIEPRKKPPRRVTFPHIGAGEWLTSMTVAIPDLDYYASG
jgi:hypothetical protein